VGGAIGSALANAGLRVSFVELAADLQTWLGRNRGEDRLLAKPSKRNLPWSDAYLHEREGWAMRRPDGAGR
jgi:hypothetical protein